MSSRTVVPASRATTKVWERAYGSSPQLAAPGPWKHVAEVLERYPGERVYEVGFGSGTNLAWARDHGWGVAGCDVAPQAVEHARALVPGADLKLESIVDCSAPSEHYDVVVDRAALCYLDAKELKRAFGQIRRILEVGGVFYFNPYGHAHTIPPPADTPEPYLYDEAAARRLFPDTKWEFVNLEHALIKWPRDGRTLVEHTLRITVRKRFA